MKKENRRLFLLLCAVPILLLIPYGFMQFSNEVNWGPMDFALAGLLLIGVGLGCELILRKVKSRKARVVLCISVVLVLAVVWIEMAVGIFGSPIAGS